ncbi:hypothetical protein [Pseudomonas putida]
MVKLTPDPPDFPLPETSSSIRLDPQCRSTPAMSEYVTAQTARRSGAPLRAMWST